MARPREFCMDQALERAMSAFWSHGYEATSLSDLMEVMDLQKGSIYKAFGDKHSLYIAALENYLEKSHEHDREQLEKSKNPKKSIQAWLTADVKNTCSQSLKRGCLMVNALNELAHQDEEVAKLIKSHLTKLNDLLANTIREGQRQGQFRNDIKANEMASILVANLIGLVSLSKGMLCKSVELQSVKNLMGLISV